MAREERGGSCILTPPFGPHPEGPVISHTPARIILAHHDESARRVLRSVLEGPLGHEVVKDTGHGHELLSVAEARDFDIFITSLRLEDGDAIRYLIKACQEDPKPSIVVTSRDSLEDVEHALEDHVMSYLVEPVTEDDLRPSIHLVLKRFAEFQDLREEVKDLQDALRGRKVIERAKGLLMKEKGLEEAEAYKRLRELASSKRKKLVDVAEAILIAAEL